MEEQIEAYTYIACSESVKNGLNPSKLYLEHLLKGKKYLSKPYFDNLRKVKTI